MVARFACLLVILEAIPVGPQSLVQVSGETQDNWPSRLGLRQLTCTVAVLADRDENKS